MISLRDFIAENSTLPQVTSYLTAPATKAEHDNAKNERVKVISPVFKAPKQEPDKNGALSLRTANSGSGSGDSSLASGVPAGLPSWSPQESEVDTYQSGGNAVIKSSYKWNQNNGHLGDLAPGWGIEIEINLRRDHLYYGSRPNCTDGPNQDIVYPDTVKKSFWAENQNWSSWSVASQWAADAGDPGLEAYADYNDLFDGCDTQGIGVGIGRPSNLPGQTQRTYGFRVTIVAPLGTVPNNNIYMAGMQAVTYNCGAWGVAQTDCMGLDTTAQYPETNGGYVYALNTDGAAYPSDPLTRMPVNTPGACWTLITGQVPQIIDCLSSSKPDVYKVAGWGANYNGELGKGDDAITPLPSPAVQGPLQGSLVSTTSSNSNGYTNCSVSGGEAYCWGEGSYGSLGNGAFLDSHVPVKVDMTGAMAGTIVTEIATSYGNTCAVASGRPFCWGSFTTNGTDNNVAVPVAINTTGALAGKRVTDVTVTDRTACVIADGKPYCWGAGDAGQLGNGTTINEYLSEPVAVDMSGVLAGRQITAIAASGMSTFCVIADGHEYCWGSNGHGELGVGNNVSVSNVPVAVGGPISTMSVSAISNGVSPCAVANGAAYCWGNGTGGHLGTGLEYTWPNYEWLPRAVDTTGALAGKTVTKIAQGDAHTCVIADAKPYCWGYNYDGMLGAGLPADTFAKSPVEVETAGTVLDGKVAYGITAGGGSTFVTYIS